MMVEGLTKARKTFCVMVCIVMVATVFAVAVNVSGANTCEGVDIEKDLKGHLHMAYQDEYELGNFEIYYKNNIGLKEGEWNPSVRITNTPSDSVEPDLGIDPITGTMFITWTEISLEGDCIYTSISRDDGKSWLEPRKMDYDIHLKADKFDPFFEEPEIPSELRLFESQGYYLVQLKSPLNQEWYDTMLALDGTVYGYVPNNAFLVKMSEDVKNTVEDMPHVRWVDLYHPAYKIQEGLMDNTGCIEINVKVFRDDGNRENLIRVTNEIKALGGEIKLDGNDNYIIVVEIDAKMIDDIAFISDVMRIDKYSSPIPHMNNIRIFTGAQFLQTFPNFYDGGGYIVGEVRDFGIDAPILGDPDPPSHGDLSRITFTQGRADESLPDAEHGTPTSGIVFGTGVGDATATGMLPNAVGAFANVRDTTRTTSIVQLDAWGGVFQSNSWGQGALNSEYTLYSQENDLLVSFYDITMLYSAGNSNDGVGPQTLSQDSVAKNVICVGGLFHYGNINENDDDWHIGPDAGSGPGVGTTPSQGPTADGRIKPDIAGPFDLIYTTDSVEGDANPGYVLGNYLANFGGTSGAAPVVAGAAGIVNQMYIEDYFGNNPGGATPHASTVKALLINSARQLDRLGPGLNTAEGDSRYQQGWGMVDLDNRLANPDFDHFIVDETSSLIEHASDTYTIWVKNDREPLKISLVWTDPPGIPNTYPILRNNLDLKVTDLTTGNVYWGNNGLITSRWSSTGGTADGQNNVENVFIENPTAGGWQIEIIAQYITADGDRGTPELDQNYALVASYAPALRVPLVEGWQLISLPLEQEDTTLETVLRSIDPYYAAVEYYDSSDAADPWKIWIRDYPYSDLWDLNHEMGLWIKIEGIPEIDLYVCGLDFTVNYGSQGYVPVPLYWNAGAWQMVGYPSNGNQPGTIALNNLVYPDDVSVIQYYDPVTGWHFMDPTIEEFELGRGYWFFMERMPSSKQWEVPLLP